MTRPGARICWSTVLDQGRTIVARYDTRVTLRQLFYQLVSALILPNTTSAYKQLSHHIAKARRVGDFPALMDRTRSIHRPISFESPDAAATVLVDAYRRERTEGQPWSIYLGVEKAGLVEQLSDWFDERGLPILPLGGYSSEDFVETVGEDVSRFNRPTVLLYAGDLDPSGEDIDRDFIKRTDRAAPASRTDRAARDAGADRAPPRSDPLPAHARPARRSAVRAGLGAGRRRGHRGTGDAAGHV